MQGGSNIFRFSGELRPFAFSERIVRRSMVTLPPGSQEGVGLGSKHKGGCYGGEKAKEGVEKKGLS